MGAEFKCDSVQTDLFILPRRKCFRKVDEPFGEHTSMAQMLVKTLCPLTNTATILREFHTQPHPLDKFPSTTSKDLSKE